MDVVDWLVSNDCFLLGQSEENAYLFTFEYEDENGELFHLVVNRVSSGPSTFWNHSWTVTYTLC